MRRLRGLCGIAALASGLGGYATLGEAAGPWRGQVVDAQTGQPLEGVVVLAVWEKVRPGVIHMARDFHDVDEVVTDAEGHFVIPTRNLSPANPFVEIEGPKLNMFKGGYGQWQFRTTWQSEQQLGSFKAAMKRFGEAGAVFELPPLEARDARRRFLSHASLTGEIPFERVPRYLQAINQERRLFRLEPIGR
jgi:hypothetical protein